MVKSIWEKANSFYNEIPASGGHFHHKSLLLCKKEAALCMAEKFCTGSQLQSPDLPFVFGLFFFKWKKKIEKTD